MLGPWSIRFAVNRSDVGFTHHAQLDEIAAALRRDPEARLRVSGHADGVGEQAYNAQLSLERAQATRDALVRAGVDPGRIELRAYGSERPLAPNDTARNRSANRRSEIELVR